MSQKKDKKISVFGLFMHVGDLGRAVTELTAAGFRPSDISALLPDLERTREFAHEKHTKAPEGAAAGAAGGAIAGGTFGLLLGLGAIVIPGLGPFLAAGPIVATLAGIGAGGAVGSLTGALIGMGIPEYEAARYESYLKNGGHLMAVHADDDDWADKARVILARCGATDIDKKKESKAS